MKRVLITEGPTMGELLKKALDDIRNYEPPELDWRVPVDMAIAGLGNELDRLQEILDGQGREADYLAQNFDLLNTHRVRLGLIASIVQERRRLLSEAAE